MKKNIIILFGIFNHENSIKFKVDKENKVNIIYQNSFSFSNINKTISFFGKIMEEM